MSPCNYAKRALAFIIDLLFVIIPGILLLAFAIPWLFADWGIAAGIGFLLVSLAWFLLADFINRVVIQASNGQTVGKRMMKIRLVSEETGLPPGLGVTFIRWLLFAFFNAITGSLFLIIDYLWPAFNDKKQRIMDKLASTMVVDVAIHQATIAPPPPLDDTPLPFA